MVFVRTITFFVWGIVAVSGLHSKEPSDEALARWLSGSDGEKAGSCCMKDRIRDFPGWTEHQPLPSPMFSGFLEYELEGRTVHTHYILMLAENHETSPSKPLLYWSNGGPGASSLFGLLAELGPLLFSELSTSTDYYRETGIPTPIYNQYSWTKLGHVLIFDQPAPVGFSYCEGPNSTSTLSDDNDSDDDIPSCAGLGWTDELAAANTYSALQAFYKKYPVFYDTDLYLTGESYAGIYIPTLAREVLKGNDATGEDAPKNLPIRGFAVGDGCLGTQTGICGVLGGQGDFDFWLVVFLAGHNQIPLHTFQEVMHACKPFSKEHEQFKGTDICQAAVAKVKKQVGGVYDYSLYDECTYSNGMLQNGIIGLKGDVNDRIIQGALNDYPCGGDIVLEQYLSLDVVRKAFHVEDADYFSVDNADGFDYTPTEPDLTGFYKHVASETNLTVLVYNGDTDPAITSFATQNWTSHLGLKALQEWRPWTSDGCKKMGGYVVRYEGNLDFLTIRGAGHMVPTYKPRATFTFLSSWLNGEDYPIFDPNCTSPDLMDSIKVNPEFMSDGESEVTRKQLRIVA